MAKPTTDEALILPEPARSLLEKTRDILDRYLSPYAADRAGWKIGGGTMLSARWQHRQSSDLDLLLHPDTATEHFDADGPGSLYQNLEDAGATTIHLDDFSLIQFPEGWIEILKEHPQPASGHGPALVDHLPAIVLSSSQIVSGKVFNRGLNPPVRDLYDIAVGAIEDPEAIEIPVNGLRTSQLDARLLAWHVEREKHAQDAEKEIIGNPEQLEPIKKRPAEYAIQAAERAIYRRVLITARHGRVIVHTESKLGRRTRQYETPAAVEHGFEAYGINHCLRACRRNPQATRNAAIEALTTRASRTLAALTPAMPPKRSEPLPPIAASENEPPATPGSAGG